MGFPPLESREDSVQALGRVDLFGTGVNPQQMDRMRKLEVCVMYCSSWYCTLRLCFPDA